MLKPSSKVNFLGLNKVLRNMQIVTSIKELARLVSEWKIEKRRMAFVPTMGNLHEGHLALCGEAREHAEKTVVSVFVNPLQFGEGEDFDTYPRTFDEDRRKLEKQKVDVLFVPSDNEIYPEGKENSTIVNVPEISTWLCGRSRPQHFMGVTTIVNKLLNIVQPDYAVFGEKDYQQLFLIRKMVKDLSMPVKIIGVPTHRESDGLARSSRNQYLNPIERRLAPLLYKTLMQLAAKLPEESADFKRLETASEQSLQAYGFRVDYISICDAKTLAPARPGISSELVVLGAVYLGATRLIDNIAVSLQKSA